MDPKKPASWQSGWDRRRYHASEQAGNDPRCFGSAGRKGRALNRALIAVVGVLVLLAGVLVVRTVLHRPPAFEALESRTIALDEALIAQHLGEAVRFETVSNQRAEDFEAEEFEAFISWVEATYPEVNSAMEQTRHGGYTLLYRWEGADASLQPVAC